MPASANDAISRAHGRDVGTRLAATRAKSTLTTANGSSANRRSDRKIVIMWSMHSTVAARANPGERCLLARASTIRE
jgi:hypothetical protein